MLIQVLAERMDCATSWYTCVMYVQRYCDACTYQIAYVSSVLDACVPHQCSPWHQVLTAEVSSPQFF